MSKASAAPEGGSAKMSCVLQDTSLATSASSVPMHIANLLKLISLQDKFNKVFVKWSLVSKPDRDILVLTLKPGAVIDSSLIYTLCMMYPFRINGPILVNLLMHVEFLLIEPDLTVAAVGEHVTPSNVEYVMLHLTSKRKRDETEAGGGAPASSDRHPTPVACVQHKDNISAIRQKLQQSLQQTNNTRTWVKKVTTGVDVGGTWVSFQIEQCEKLNLDCIGQFHLALDDMAVKVRPAASQLFLVYFVHFVLAKIDAFLPSSMCRQYRSRWTIPSMFWSAFTNKKNVALFPDGSLCRPTTPRIYRRLLPLCARFANQIYNVLRSLDSHDVVRAPETPSCPLVRPRTPSTTSCSPLDIFAPGRFCHPPRAV